MAVESADDLAAMFDEDDFAEEATFTPSGGGASVECSVIVSQPREVERAGFAGVAAYNTAIWVRKSEVSAPDGGTFTLRGADYRVKSPELDETGKIWKIWLPPTT